MEQRLKRKYHLSGGTTFSQTFSEIKKTLPNIIKKNEMKKITFLAFAFIMLFSTKSFSQKNIFTYLTNFSVDSLTQEQRLIFDKIKRQNRYISINFIRIFDIKLE